MTKFLYDYVEFYKSLELEYIPRRASERVGCQGFPP
jgi:hypothetical protein